MSVCKQTPRKNVQLVNQPSKNTACVTEIVIESLADGRTRGPGDLAFVPLVTTLIGVYEKWRTF